MSYPPTPQRKACNCSDPCISTDDVYYAGPNLPNSGINTYNVLTEVIEKLDAIYAVPTLQKVTEVGNYTTLPIIADSFVKIGGDGTNILLDDGTVLPIGDLPSPTTPGLQEVLTVGNTDNIGNSMLFIDPSDTNNLSGINYGGHFVVGNELNNSLSSTSMLNTGIRFYNSDIGSDTLHFNANLTTDDKSNWGYTNNYFIPKKPEGTYTLATLDDIPAPLGYTPVNKAGDTMLGDLILNEDPSTALGAATKQYVDNIAAGINFHAPVTVATDVSLVATYNNGVDGLGATLTGTSVGVLMIDGETPAYLQRILVWQQINAIENGIYDLTTVGDGTTIYQLTRSTDADNSPVGEIQYGDYVLVLSGDTNGGFGFICNTPGTIDIGITPINYVQFNAAQAVTAGYGLQELTPNVISINPLETQEKITLTTTGTGAATLDDLTNTLNIPTIGVVSATETGVVNNTSLQELGGVDKTINGVRVGRGNISDPASENTAVGYQALQSVIHTTGDEGYYNTAFGDEALKSLTTGNSSSAFGDWALRLCTTGSYNTGIGGGALMGLTTGSYNLAVGENSLLSNVSGQRNTAVGSFALNLNTGSYNTAIGMLAGGLSTSSGNWNILVGMQAGRDISTGGNNLLIENITNASITSGSFNIVLNPKQKSGVTTGSFNTIIGCWDGAFPNAMANNVIIGDGQGNIRFRTTETGLTTVPGQTNALIDGDTTGKAVVTKEYLSTTNYWTKTGNDIYNNNTGNIIIGATTAPNPSLIGKLNIVGNIYTTGKVWSADAQGFRFNDGASGMYYRATQGLEFVVYGDGTSALGHYNFTPVYPLGGNPNYVSGTTRCINTSGTYAAISGSVSSRIINIEPTINQTGTANGIIRGLYINPTLTSAYDFRAIEVTAGKVIVPTAINSNEAVNKGQVDNRLVVETAVPYTLTDTDSGGIVIFTASTTLTIPTGLAAGFECTFVTLAGVTLTVSAGSNVLNNATGTLLAPQLSFTLKRMIAANTFIATGNL